MLCHLALPIHMKLFSSKDLIRCLISLHRLWHCHPAIIRFSISSPSFTYALTAPVHLCTTPPLNVYLQRNGSYHCLLGKIILNLQMFPLYLATYHKEIAWFSFHLLEKQFFSNDKDQMNVIHLWYKDCILFGQWNKHTKQNKPHFSSFAYSLKTRIRTKQFKVNVNRSDVNQFV